MLALILLARTAYGDNWRFQALDHSPSVSAFVTAREANDESIWSALAPSAEGEAITCSALNKKNAQWLIGTYKVESNIDALGSGARWRFGTQLYWIDGKSKNQLKRLTTRASTVQGKGDRHTSKLLACQWLPRSGLVFVVTGGRMMLIDIVRSIFVVDEINEQLNEDVALYVYGDKTGDHIVIKGEQSTMHYVVKKATGAKQ